MSEEQENVQDEKVEKKREEQEIHEGEEDSFEDELVKKLLEGVKLIIKDQETRGDSEIIKAEIIEMQKDFEPEVPAEELGNVEEAISKRIDHAVDAVSNLIEKSREDFRESLKKQITAFRNQVYDMGKNIARAFAQKLNLKFTERHLRKTYEDIITKELKKRQELIIRDTLESLKPFYAGIQQNLKEIQKVLVEMRSLYRDWIEAYTSIIQEAVSESKIDYDKLMREIRNYKSRFEELQTKIQDLNVELAKKEAEIEELKQKLKEQPKEVVQATPEEVEKLKNMLEEREKLIEELKQKNVTLLNTLQAIISPILKGEELPRDTNTEELQKIVKEFSATIKNLEKQIKELKDEIIEKDGEITKLRTLLETYKDAERIQEELENVKREHAKLKGEYEAIKESYDMIKEENQKLKQKLQEIHSELLDSMSYETSKETLAELLREKDEEIEKLREKLKEMEKIKAEYTTLTEKLALKDREINNLKQQIKEYEELESALSGLRKEIESYKEMLGISVEPPPAEVEKKFSELFEQVKSDLELMRHEVFEKSKQMAEIISENKALKSQVELKEKEIEELKAENKRLLSELQESKVQLKQKSVELKETEKKLVEALNRLEKLEKEPAEYRKILGSTTIGKIFLLVKDLKSVDLDKLAGAIGMSKIQLQREILKLAQLGLVKLENNTVYYIG
ncbi:MAG: hypothetical protein ACP6IP_05455 [Candidatus Njordarchaeia archaeon]